MMTQLLRTFPQVRVTKTGNFRARPVSASVARGLGLQVPGGALLYRTTPVATGTVAFNVTGRERTFQPLREHVRVPRGTCPRTSAARSRPPPLPTRSEPASSVDCLRRGARRASAAACELDSLRARPSRTVRYGARHHTAAFDLHLSGCNGSVLTPTSRTYPLTSPAAKKRTSEKHDESTAGNPLSSACHEDRQLSCSARSSLRCSWSRIGPW
jgi:hypothetical protein